MPRAPQAFVLDPELSTEPDSDRKIEDWVVRNLDDRDPPKAGRDWTQWIDGLPNLRRDQKNTARPVVQTGSAFGAWGRFQVVSKRGVTLVRLKDQHLVKESEIQELVEDLLGLIEAGRHRLLISFEAVDRLSSWVVGALAEAQKRCLATGDGLLKVCELRPAVASVFAMIDQAKTVPVCATQTEALESPWPAVRGPRPLPVDILAALTRAGDPFASHAFPSSPDSRIAPVEPIADRRATDPESPRVWLIAEGEKATRRSIPLRSSPFLIGRDPSCQLRPGSPMVSRLHAVIERRDRRVFLRDLQSTNGTHLNGRLLQNKELEIQDGDRVQIGPLRFALAVGNSNQRGEEGPKTAADGSPWVLGDDANARAIEGEATTIGEFPAFETETRAPSRVRHEVVENVLVITPLASHLDDETAIDPLRAELIALFNGPLPNRVVVNLENVIHLSSQAIGVLVAHHLRLDRAGGGLRICKARARIRALLDQVRLPMLVECCAAVEDAVFSPWPTVVDRRKS